mgnify:CR=1 FL=1
MSNTLTEQTPRVYEPPRLVLPSEKQAMPEGKRSYANEINDPYFGSYGPS